LNRCEFLILLANILRRELYSKSFYVVNLEKYSQSSLYIYSHCISYVEIFHVCSHFMCTDTFIVSHTYTYFMCCSVLQCVAVCCSVLQCVAVCCVIQTLSLYLIRRYISCVAVCCSVLQCAAVCCSVLQCVAVCCSVLRYTDPFIVAHT